jgi:PAS domain S-box-containing protein
VIKDKKELAEILATVPGVIWEVKGDPADPQMVFSYINKYVVSFLGYSYKKWQTTPGFWLQTILPEEQKRVRREFHQIFVSKKERSTRYRLVKKNGSSVWVRTRLSVMVDADGKPVGVRGITTDITYYMQIENRKDEFISMASHELKTPLTSIKAYAQLLKKYGKELNDPVILSYLERMNAQVDRLADLIFRMLDTTRIHAGKLVLHRTRFAMDELIREVVQDVRNLSQQHPIQAYSLLPVFVTADRPRITQVLTNFLTNAIKYSPVGSPIIIRIVRDKAQTTVEVQDFGKGISKENQKHIFERFFQATNKHPHDQSLGLGLYIASEIMKQHDGQIGVKSKKGHGSTFSFSLPNDEGL